MTNYEESPKSKFDVRLEREHEKELLNMRQSFFLRITSLILLGLAGIASLGFGAYLALVGNSATLVLTFLASGVMLLAFGMTVAIGELQSKSDKIIKELSSKSFLDEFDRNNS